jgi:hypothetical protein
MQAVLGCLEAGACFSDQFGEFLSESLVGPDARLRQSALRCLNRFLRSATNSSPFVCLLPLLFELTRTEPPIVRDALRTLKLLSRIPNFDQFQTLFPPLLALVPALPGDLLEPLLECFTVTAGAAVPPDLAFVAFECLFRELEIGRHPRPLCRALSALALRFDTSGVSQAVYTVALALHAAGAAPEALSLAASLDPAFLGAALGGFLPLLLAQPPSDDGAAPARDALARLVGRVDLGPCTPEVVRAVAEAFERGRGAAVKGAAVGVFTKMITETPEIGASVMAVVAPTIRFVAENLRTMARLYGESSKLLLRPVCAFLSAGVQIPGMTLRDLAFFRAVVVAFLRDQHILQMVQAEISALFVLLVRQYQVMDSLAEADELLRLGMESSAHIRRMVESTRQLRRNGHLE